MSIDFTPFLPTRATRTPCADQIPLPADHYLMYQIKESKEMEKFEKIDVQLEDQFQAGIFTVEKPVELLNPASKNDEAVSNPDTHPQSYKVNGPKLDQKIENVTIENQFGSLQVDVNQVREDNRQDRGSIWFEVGRNQEGTIALRSLDKDPACPVAPGDCSRWFHASARRHRPNRPFYGVLGAAFGAANSSGR